jgi:hypothetical protein
MHIFGVLECLVPQINGALLAHIFISMERRLHLTFPISFVPVSSRKSMCVLSRITIAYLLFIEPGRTDSAYQGRNILSCLGDWLDKSFRGLKS